MPGPQLNMSAEVAQQLLHDQGQQPAPAPGSDPWTFVFMPPVPVPLQQLVRASGAAAAMLAPTHTNHVSPHLSHAVAKPEPQPNSLLLVLPPGITGHAVPVSTLQPVLTPILSVASVQKPTRAELIHRAIMQVREILPDIEPDYLLAHVSAWVDTLRERTADHLLGVLFETEEGEGGGYPKATQDQPWPRAGGSSLTPGRIGHATDAGNNGVDYQDTNRPAPSQAYRRLSVFYLRLAFPFLPKHIVTSALYQHNDQYAPTYLYLYALEQQYTAVPICRERPYRCNSTKYSGTAERRALAHIWDNKFGEEWLWVEVQQGKGSNVDYMRMRLRHGAPRGLSSHLAGDHLTASDAETRAIPSQPAVQPWLGEVKAPDVDVEMVSVEDQLIEGEHRIECGCCFSDFTSDQMVQCASEHRFCSDCVRQYAAIQLGAHNPSLVCMHSSDCKIPFPESELVRVLTPTLMALYTRLSTQQAIAAADLQGLEECPFCDWKCVNETPIEMDSLFRCGNEEGGCGVVSCRRCNKEDHFPKMCEENEEDGILNARHAIEEAMTAALMRNCPNLFCKKPFVKEAGCNKMVCPHCRTVSCYVCREIIAGYEHFDQMPGAPGNATVAVRCKLWDDVEERHANEIHQAANRAVEELNIVHPGIDHGAMAMAHFGARTIYPPQEVQVPDQNWPAFPLAMHPPEVRNLFN